MALSDYLLQELEHYVQMMNVNMKLKTTKSYSHIDESIITNLVRNRTIVNMNDVSKIVDIEAVGKSSGVVSPSDQLALVKELEANIWQQKKSLPESGAMRFGFDEENDLEMSKRSSYCLFISLASVEIIPKASWSPGYGVFKWDKKLNMSMSDVSGRKVEELNASDLHDIFEDGGFLNFDDYFEIKEEYRGHRLNHKYGL